MLKELFALCLFVAVAFPEQVSYDGYQVIRAKITTSEQLSKIAESNLDVWSGSSVARIGLNDIMVNASHLEDLIDLGVVFERLIDDVGKLFKREKSDILEASTNAQASWFDSYHTYDEILTFLSNLTVTHPGMLQYTPAAGRSIENRAIPLIRIVGGKAAVKKHILIVGGQHAREWIGPAIVLYMLNKLVTGYATDTAIAKIVDSVDFTFVPVANPDGYLFSWASNRLWRKNRRANAGGTYGVDLNRNWDDHWCVAGGSTVPSNDAYCGTGPFSEPESQTLRSISLQFAPFDGAFDFHSYGQLIMRPYGWSNTFPPNNAQLLSVGNGMRSAILANSGKAYTNQAIHQLYLASGSSCDYWVNAAKIPLSYGFEVRDTGTYGFSLPANQIVPTGEENWAAVLYLINSLLAN